MKDIVVLYHADCPDGFGSAWAAYKRFGEDASYVAVYHDMPPPAGLGDKEIYMVDFAYAVPVMKDIIASNKKVTAIDHHVSRESAVKLTRDFSYAIENSGSVLTWKYFNKDKTVPKLLSYIEDRDLFRFKLKDSHSACAFIDTLDYDFKTWDDLADSFEDDKEWVGIIEKGSVIVKYEEEIIKRLVGEGSKVVNFEGYETYVVNAPHIFASDIGKKLYTSKPPIAIIWSEDKDNVHVSLRSDGTVDVSELAARFGGGGHKESSGFSLPSVNSFPWKNKKD